MWPSALGPQAELPEEPGLPDPGLALDGQAGRAALPERGQHRIELFQLDVAPNGLLRAGRHRWRA